MSKADREDKYAGRTHIKSGQYGGGNSVKVNKDMKDFPKMREHAKSMSRQHDKGKRQTEADVKCWSGHPMAFQTRDLGTWAWNCNKCNNKLGDAFASCTVGCPDSFVCEDCFFSAGGNTSRDSHWPGSWDSHWPGLPGYSSSGASSSTGWNRNG